VSFRARRGGLAQTVHQISSKERLTSYLLLEEQGNSSSFQSPGMLSPVMS